MAASGYTPISLYHSTTPSATPSAGNLTAGELAINTADGKLFYKDSSNVVQVIATKAGAGGTVTSVALSGGTTGLTVSGSPITTSGTITLAGTLAVANGGTGATTNTVARTNLGATTLGSNLFTIANPSAITFPRFNADNTVSSLSAADFRTAIGAGTGGGTVTSVSGTGTVNGITLTGTVTSSGSLTLGGTLSGVNLTSQVTGTLPVANGGTGQTTTQAAINSLAGAVTSGQYLRGNGTNVVMSSIQVADVPTLNQNTTGSAATLTTARTIQTNLASTSSASFNGSANITPGVTGTLPVANGGTGATTLSGVVIGNGTSAFTVKTNPSGAFVGTTDTQTLSAKTITNLIFDGNYTEEVFTITDGASVDLNPANGTIQLWTLGANRSPTANNFAAGQSMTLMIDDGSAYSITWPSVTWRNNAGTAPTLATSGFTVVALWKVSTTLYGVLVGNGT
jgi:hypothetical protein